MKSPVILLILLGAALVAFVIALSLGPFANPGAIEKLLPVAIDGFALVYRIERSEPGFTEQGELYSSHAFFAPLSGSEYERHVNSLGIAIYLFKGASGAKQAKELLLSGTKPQLVKVSQQTVALFGGDEQVGILWQEQRLLFHILVTASKDGEVDMELLKRAAISAARVLIERKHQ